MLSWAKSKKKKKKQFLKARLQNLHNLKFISYHYYLQ